ncbi:MULTISPECIES: LysE family translocator [Oceanimonas]|uniref:Threonine transporter RhtB n=1 Tax=Oceanimonas doudoroffii TaxID=84158 RepID=A0A233RBL5_9GAMM|nr:MULTISPECIES: LysE family translocator [Oceanimonas]NHI02180.1 Homoserine/homoserine lactone efflux protein [Oceanimonas sp. MB9]OXY80777.1 threonine transporter RhtB [Oceanimonas doudoroffii]
MVFVPTFFFVSVTPGMCMTLALSLGMTVGVKRTLWMMLGELAGVGLVACLAVIGVAALMLQYPELFLLLKYGGGLYLAWLGLQLWRSRGKLALNPVDAGPRHIPAATLVSQGFVTAIANPKGWAFFIALLPPFIDNQAPLAGQLAGLVSIILSLEFICMLLYASGGRTLSRVLQQKGKVKLMNRIAGSLMLGVALWLVLG